MDFAGSQIAVFLTTVYTGMMLGLLYDINSLIKSLLRLAVLMILTDVVYYLLFFGACVAVFYYTGDLILRGYTFLGVAAGFLLYMAGISRLFKTLFAQHRQKKQKKAKRKQEFQSRISNITK